MCPGLSSRAWEPRSKPRELRSKRICWTRSRNGLKHKNQFDFWVSECCNHATLDDFQPLNPKMITTFMAIQCFLHDIGEGFHAQSAESLQPLSVVGPENLKKNTHNSRNLPLLGNEGNWSNPELLLLKLRLCPWLCPSSGDTTWLSSLLLYDLLGGEMCFDFLLSSPLTLRPMSLSSKPAPLVICVYGPCLIVDFGWVWWCFFKTTSTPSRSPLSMTSDECWLFDIGSVEDGLLGLFCSSSCLVWW